jgi:hypothetical protein
VGCRVVLPSFATRQAQGQRLTATVSKLIKQSAHMGALSLCRSVMACSVVLDRDATRYVGSAAPKNRPLLIARLMLVPLLVAVCAGHHVPAARCVPALHDVSVRSCPWGGSRGMHTDCQLVQRPRTAGSGATHLTGKPLVIVMRVPLVTERRK